jgi:hypothetical protein
MQSKAGHMRTIFPPTRGRLGACKRLILLVVALLICVLGVSSLTASRAHATALSSSTLGTYIGGGNTSGFNKFSDWLGAKPAYVLDYVDGSSWSTIEDPTWTADQWAHSGARVVLSVPMLPPSGATLAQGAAGDYNSYFTNLAHALVAAGDSNAILRLGWEMNGNWYPWSIQNGNAANYAAYWQQIVTTMRAVSPSFQFDFCPNSGPTTVNGVVLDPENAYPGNAYVNYIGLDQYDQSWVSDAGNEANRWQGYLTQAYGLEWQKNFAAAHDKQVTFPEWGLVQGSNGGGDSPAFIQDMYNWMASYGSDLAYENYFDFSNSTLSDFPNAATLYKQLFDGSGAPVHHGTADLHKKTSVKARAASVVLRVNSVRKADRVVVHLRWSAGGATVTIFRNQRRLRTERHRNSLLLRYRSASRRAVSYYVCEVKSHVCSAHHRV